MILSVAADTALSWGYAMQDIIRDWRRWSFEERVIALLICGIVASVPFAFALLAQFLR
jgi:hypothetical protein